MTLDLKEMNILLAEAVLLAKEGDTILLEDKTYYEKIKITQKGLTLLGRKNSRIAFDAYHGAIIPEVMGGDGVKRFGTTGSATFTVLEGADGFTAKNITFLNYFKRNGTKNGQAVAFKSEINGLRIENCRFISEQDTLYVDYGKDNLIVNSYIEGDVDFIFGSANCVFSGCEIVANPIYGKAYFLAPDTFCSNTEGFIFRNCDFRVVSDAKVYLGRAWFPSGARESVYPRATLQNCRLSGNIEMDLIQMHEQDLRSYELKIENCSLNQRLISSRDRK